MRAPRCRTLLQALRVSVAIVWCAAPCRADGTRRAVVVLTRPGGPAPQRRLQEELTAAGFEVELSELQTGAASPADVVERAKNHRASAALLLKTDGAEMLLCVVATDSAQASCRNVSLEGETARDGAELLAIRAVEALRAALLEVSQPPAKRAPEPRGASDVSPRPGGAGVATRRTATRLGVSLRAGGSASPGGIGALSALGVSVLWRPVPALNLALDGSLTPWTRTLSAAEGKASVGAYRVGPSATWILGGANAWFTAHVGGGAWLNVLVLSGEPNPAYKASQVRIWSFIPHANLGLRFALSRRIQLGPDSSMGYSLPGSAVSFVGRRVAVWGRPMFVGHLAIDAYFD